MYFLLPFHPGDQAAALKWVSHVHRLGCGHRHSLILMPARAVRDYAEVKSMALLAFANISILPDAEGITGHPQGPNSMMRQAAWHFQTSNLGPWTFCEPDNIPLTKDSFDVWEREYIHAGKPFMGEFRAASGIVPDYLTGNMVLPADPLIKAPMLGRRGLSVDGTELAFDLVAASQILPQAHLTKLLQQVPKNPDGSSHNFPDQQSLSLLRPGAVFFHPCKDGSLIDRLRERRGELDSSRAHIPAPAGSIPAPATSLIEPSLASEAVLLTQDDAGTISLAEPKSIVQTMRDHCRSLAEIVGDLPNRKQQLHKELRAAGLIGKAKMKKRKRMMV